MEAEGLLFDKKESELSAVNLVQPLVSVIVPVYNVEEYLVQCLDSLCIQTLRDIEIILLDDASVDRCGKICEEYAARDSRFKVIHFTKNQGLSVARNTGISLAKATYLMFLDSDDWIEPNMLEMLTRVAYENMADIVICGIFQEYPDHTVAVPAPVVKYTNVISAVIKSANDTGAAWGKLYRRVRFMDINFPCGHVFEEYATVYKYYLQAASIISIAQPFYHYRKQRSGSITESHSVSNLVDFWLAQKSRYDFFLKDERFNSDKELLKQLKQYCAIAIARTWRWCYDSSEQERQQYASSFKEMKMFSVNHFSCFGEEYWPLYLRFSIFMARFNSVFVFALLYYLNQGYKWLVSAGNFYTHWECGRNEGVKNPGDNRDTFVREMIKNGVKRC